MQRLFSTFADGPPGAGLLIQRLLVGTALVYCAVAKPGYSVEAPQVIGALAGILLIAGFWTPVAGVLAGCAEAWVAFSSPAHIWNCRRIGGAWRYAGADRARRVVPRCTALRQKAHSHSGPCEGFFESHQKHSARLSEAAGTDCEPNRSAALGSQRCKAERSLGRIMPTTLAKQ